MNFLGEWKRPSLLSTATLRAKPVAHMLEGGREAGYSRIWIMVCLMKYHGCQRLVHVITVRSALGHHSNLCSYQRMNSPVDALPPQFFRIRNLGWFCGWEPITTFRQRSVVFVRDKRLSWTPNPGDLSFSFKTRSLQGVMTGSIDCFLQGSVVGGTEKSHRSGGSSFLAAPCPLNWLLNSIP